MTENQAKEEVKEEVNIKEQLDEVFVQHIERLLGTSYGIDGLALNLTTVPCLVLLAERETEIESFPFVPPERYDESKLTNELSEVSLDPGEDLKTAIQDMIDKDYLEIGDDEKYFAQKPTLSMSQIMDHIFPQMPGINLIAYVGQMIDEVHGSRREISHAKAQLDQLLKQQGVPLKETKDDSSENNEHTVSSKSEKPESASGTKQRAKTRTSEWLKPSDIYSHLKTDSWGMMPSSSNTQTLGQNPEIPAIQQMHMDPFSTPDTSIQSSVTLDNCTSAPEQNQPPSQTPEDQTTPLQTEPSESMDSQPSANEIEQDLSRSDDDIERQIAAFEEGLGLICPMCRNGQLEIQSTTKGKDYYLCSNKSCNFISWGRPFYHTCPQCNIPFLIETTDHEGNQILKCPRATCRFWSEFPQEGSLDLPENVVPLSIEKKKKTRTVRRPRKRVRRRVVRRKR
jgi:hypothetical protein